MRGSLRLGRRLGGRGRLRLHRLDAHDDGDGRGGDAPLHDLEELEPFLLVLDLRILLPVTAQVDALAQVVHLQQVVLPQLIDGVQVEPLRVGAEVVA